VLLVSELSECFYECVLIFWQNLGARLAAMTVEKNFILLKVEVKFCFGGKLRGVAKCVSLKVRFANPILMVFGRFQATFLQTTQTSSKEQLRNCQQ
jgi:hypothetical protein